VNQLDQMTQQNAALVEESAAAAESLKDQAARLAQVVQVFRIASTAVQPVAAVRGLPAPPASSVARSSPAAAPKRLSKPAPMALKQPTLTAGVALRPAPSASPKPVATSGSEGDWESF
jgi:methyl-accepting chemotaxis protein